MRVAVIGAGISGLSAARTLLQEASGAIQVTLFEAKHRIGGRLHTSEHGFDMGASWVHGISTNPLVSIAKELNLTLEETVFDKNFFLFRSPHSASRFTPETCRQMIDVSNAAMDVIHEPWFVPQVCSAHASMQEAYDAAVDQVLLKERGCTRSGLSVDEVTVLHWLQQLEEHILGGPFETVPARRYVLYNEGKGHSMVRGGYDQLAKAYLASIQAFASKRPACFRLVLGCPVSSITVDPIHQVKVRTVAGDVHDFDYCIVAVPLGVLKSKQLQFDPPLSPERHLSFIDQDTQFHAIEKLFLVFERNFWSSDAYFGAVYEKDIAKRGDRLFMNFLDYSSILPDKRNVLMAWIHREDMGVLDVNLVKNGTYLRNTLDLLKQIFPESGIDVDNKLVGNIMSTWSTDAYTQGSWSCPAYPGNNSDLESAPADGYFDKIQDWHAQRVLFAGEHTHRSYFATVHGALFTGRDQARRVLHAGKPPMSKL
jgi:monoamine oxidase